MNQSQITYCTVTWGMENVFCLTISVTCVCHIAMGFVSAEHRVKKIWACIFLMAARPEIKGQECLELIKALQSHSPSNLFLPTWTYLLVAHCLWELQWVHSLTKSVPSWQNNLQSFSSLPFNGDISCLNHNTYQLGDPKHLVKLTWDWLKLSHSCQHPRITTRIKKQWITENNVVV